GAAAPEGASADRATRSLRAAARHPPRGDRADPGAGLSLLLSGWGGLCPSFHWADLVLSGGAVCAGYHRRHLLEGRYAHCRVLRPGGGLPGLDLYAVAALFRQVGLAADHLPLPRAVRHRSPQAARSEEHTSELQSRFDLVCRL